jgi:histone H3/H4
VTERSVREMLTRASRDLSRVNYTRLSADGRAQYEQSKRFSAQAEDALRERNLVFAATLADKAATLAAELLAR